MTGIALDECPYLSGSLALELGDLAFLITLTLNTRASALTGDGLSGPIPPELGGLARLERLDLWSNNLSGAVPPGLAELRRLKYLNLADNRFSGPLPRSLMSLKLDSSSFENTSLCVPADAEFREWLSKIHDLTPWEGAKVYCK